MGVCSSLQLQHTTNQERLLITNGSSSTAKVIHSTDGKLEEFRQPVTASHVLSDHSDTFFLCNSETMFVNCHVPHVPADEELRPGQIYFLLPKSKSNKPLSLGDLCSLAIKASLAMEKSGETMTKGGTASFGLRTLSFSKLRKSNGEATEKSGDGTASFGLRTLSFSKLRKSNGDAMERSAETETRGGTASFGMRTLSFSKVRKSNGDAMEKSGGTKTKGATVSSGMRTMSFSKRRKSSGDGRVDRNAEFQLALKKL